MIRLNEHAESIDRLAVEVAKLKRRAKLAEARADAAEAELVRLSPLLQVIARWDAMEYEEGSDYSYNKGCGKVSKQLLDIAAVLYRMVNK